MNNYEKDELQIIVMKISSAPSQPQAELKHSDVRQQRPDLRGEVQSLERGRDEPGRDREVVEDLTTATRDEILVTRDEILATGGKAPSVRARGLLLMEFDVGLA
jgi:hypothetical protein